MNHEIDNKNWTHTNTEVINPEDPNPQIMCYILTFKTTKAELSKRLKDDS